MADLLIVQRWLIALGRLTVAARSEADAADFLDEVAPLLAMRFPDEVFNSGSLEYVAAECKYLPTYGEIVAHLREWRQSFRPASSLENLIDLDPTEPGRTTMTRLDQHHLTSWFKLRQAKGADLAATLDRFRQRHPVVFSHICHTDTEAAGIAVQHGWPVDASEPVERSDAEMDHAHATVAATLAALAAARSRT